MAKVANSIAVAIYNYISSKIIDFKSTCSDDDNEIHGNEEGISIVGGS